MPHRLSESSHFRRLVVGEISSGQHLSGEYIRFCPTEAWQPHLNIYETDAAWLVCVDIAGLKPDAIHVDLQDRTLIVRGTRTPPMPAGPQGDIGVHAMEIDAGSFCREVDFESAVDRSRITASYRDGLLWITLPKSS